MEQQTKIQIALFIYGMICGSWAIFAWDRQKKYHPNASLLNNIFCYVANFVGFPLCVIIAIKNRKKFKQKNEGTKQ